MDYWGRASFESLSALAQEFAGHSDLVGLAEYCRLRDKGLRSQALIRLDEFLNQASLWASDRARRHVILILEANDQNHSHQFMCHPLLTQLIYPTLEQWINDEPLDAEPLGWIGLLRCDASALKRALCLRPNDIRIRRQLIEFETGDLDYSTHHLNESLLLSTVEKARESIAAARELIASADSVDPFSDQWEELDEYEQIIDDWEHYCLSREGSFPEWCKTRGRSWWFT